MVNAEFFGALERLEKEKGIPVDYMLDRVGQALITAYKRDNDGMTDNVYVEPDRDKKTIHMFVRKTVVKAEDLYEPYEEITLEEAAEYKNNPMVGDIIDIDIPTKSFGRIAAQTAKQVIIQGIREAERGMVYLRVREQGARDPERRGCPHRSALPAPLIWMLFPAARRARLFWPLPSRCAVRS